MPDLQGRCWPNGCPKQDCIVVPPPSNIMEVKKKKKYYRGQNRTLIKYTSKIFFFIVIKLKYLLITIVALNSYLWL